MLDTLDDNLLMMVSSYLDDQDYISYLKTIPKLIPNGIAMGTIDTINSNEITQLCINFVVCDLDISLMERALRAIKRYFSSSALIRSRYWKNTLNTDLRIFDRNKFFEMFEGFFYKNSFMIRRSGICMKVIVDRHVLVDSLKVKLLVLKLSDKIHVPLSGWSTGDKTAHIDMYNIYKQMLCPNVFGMGMCEARPING